MALQHGFYWPTALKDAKEIVKTCSSCQRFSQLKHTPSAALKTIPITWPFAVWGLDMVGPFKTARSGMTHLLVAVDKFTKWIEAKPIKKLDGATVIKFFTDIIIRFGYPHSIITDKAPISPRVFSPASAETRASVWTWHRSHTHSPTGSASVLTAWF